MEQIRSGAKLTHVDSESESVKSSNSSNGGGGGGGCGRDALLTQIRSGVHLKPIEAARKAASAAPVEVGGLAGALQRALEERSRMMNQTDDSTSSDEDADGDEDEWDD